MKQIRLKNGQLFEIEDCRNCPFADATLLCIILEKQITDVEKTMIEDCFLEDK